MNLEEFRANVLQLMEEERWELAAMRITGYFKQEPQNHEIRGVCGLIYSVIISEEVDFQPLTSEECLWRGICGRGARDIVETLRDHGKAVTLNPENHYALKWRANWYYEAGLYHEAKSDLLKAISISEEAEYYNDLANVCISEQDYESALFYNLKAVKFRPEYDAYL